MEQRSAPRARTDPAPWEWEPVCIETESTPGIDDSSFRRLFYVVAPLLVLGMLSGQFVPGLALYVAAGDPGIGAYTLLLAALLIGAQYYSGRIIGSSAEAVARAIELDDAASTEAGPRCSTAWAAGRELLLRGWGRARLAGESDPALSNQSAPGLSYRMVGPIVESASMGPFLGALFAGAALCAAALQQPVLFPGGGKTLVIVMLVSNLSMAAGWTALWLLIRRAMPREIRTCDSRDHPAEGGAEEAVVPAVDAASRSRAPGWYVGDPSGVWLLSSRINGLVNIGAIMLVIPLLGFLSGLLLHGGWSFTMFNSLWALPFLAWIFYQHSTLARSLSPAGRYEGVPPRWQAGPYVVRSGRLTRTGIRVTCLPQIGWARVLGVGPLEKAMPNLAFDIRVDPRNAAMTLPAESFVLAAAVASSAFGLSRLMPLLWEDRIDVGGWIAAWACGVAFAASSCAAALMLAETARRASINSRGEAMLLVIRNNRRTEEEVGLKHAFCLEQQESHQRAGE